MISCTECLENIGSDFGFSPYYGFQLRSFYDLKQSGKIFFGD
jgi:hypothetical protein